MEKVKAGIIGLGFMSVAHIKAYRKLEDVEIVAVCNPSGRRLDGDLSDVFGNVGDQEPVKLDMEKIKGYRDVDAFLNHPGLQLVDICFLTDTHTDLAIRALNAGKHVLCEKPITRTSEEAARLVEAVKAPETHFMPAMCLRFWPEWTFLKKAIEDQTYGKALGVRFRRVAEPPGWSPQNYLDGKKSGGALLDGQSFVPVLRGWTDHHKQYSFGLQTTRGINHGSDYYGIRSVRSDRFRYIRNLTSEVAFRNTMMRSGWWQSWVGQAERGSEHAKNMVHRFQYRPAEELYDSENDPWNLVNLADRPEFQSVKEQLSQALDDWMQDQGDAGQETELDALNRQWRNRAR